MAILLLDNGEEVELNKQAISKIKPKSSIAVLFSYNELFRNKNLKQENSEKLKLLLNLKEKKQIQFLPMPFCSAEQKIVEEFNRKAINAKPEGFYTEGAYLKPISLYEKIRDKGLELMATCRKCLLHAKKCPGCFEVISGRNLGLLVDTILKQIKSNDVVVDIGCGQGFYISSLLGLLNNPTHLFLVDPKTVLLKELPTARDIGDSRGLHLICSIAEYMPFKSKAFNVMLLINSFSHFSEPLKAVSEISRVLKEHASVYLIESKELSAESEAKTYDKHNMLGMDEIKGIFASEGFKLTLTKKAEPYYLLVFEKGGQNIKAKYSNCTRMYNRCS